MTLIRNANIETWARTVGAHKLDGDETTLSDREYASTLGLVSKFGLERLNINIASPVIQARAYGLLEDYYAALPATPRKQIVYVDVSPFRQKYEAHWEANLEGFDFDIWLADYLAKVRSRFVMADGSQLNIEIVTKRPTSGEYAVVVLTTEPDTQTLQGRPFTEKLAYITGLKHNGESEEAAEFRQALQEFRAKHSHLKSPEALVDAFLASDFMQRNPHMEKDGSVELGQAFKGEPRELGNPSLDDLGIVRGYEYVNNAHYTVFRNQFQKGALMLAETTAHEIGHMLGLEHLNKDSIRAGQLEPSLMMQTDSRYQHTQGKRLMPFSESEMSYLSYILGVVPPESKQGCNRH